MPARERRVEVRVEAAFVADVREQVSASMAGCARALQRSIEHDMPTEIDAAFSTLAELRGVLAQLPVPPVFKDPAPAGAQLGLEVARPRAVAGTTDVFVTGDVDVLLAIAAAGVERHAFDTSLVDDEDEVRAHAERVIYYSDMRAFLAREATDRETAEPARPRLSVVQAS